MSRIVLMAMLLCAAPTVEAQGGSGNPGRGVPNPSEYAMEFRMLPTARAGEVASAVLAPGSNTIVIELAPGHARAEVLSAAIGISRRLATRRASGDVGAFSVRIPGDVRLPRAEPGRVAAISRILAALERSRNAREPISTD